MPSQNSTHINREIALLFGPRPARVIREFDAHLQLIGVPARMSLRQTGEQFLAFASARERLREKRSQKKRLATAIVRMTSKRLGRGRV